MHTYTPPPAPFTNLPAKSPYGVCLLCQGQIWTSFVHFPVVRAARRNARTYYARAHDSCAEKNRTNGTDQ